MSVNEEELDQIIGRAEHTKDLPLSPQLWDRLDGKLEVNRQKKRSARYKLYSMVSTAACFILLLGVFFKSTCIMTDSKAFVIESLDEIHPSNSVYQVEDINLLHRNTFSCQPC